MDTNIPVSEIDTEAVSGEAEDQDNPWVLPLVVKLTPYTSHEGIVLAVGRAVAKLRHYTTHYMYGFTEQECGRLIEWEKGRVRKVVKRAKPGSAWNRALASSVPHVVEPVFVEGVAGEDITEQDIPLVAAFPPVQVAEMPKNIARLQVSGLDVPFSREGKLFLGEGGCDTVVFVFVSPFVPLSTGKEAAQVAHAIQFSYKKMREEYPVLFRQWVECGFCFNLVYPSVDEWLAGVAEADVVIRDAGFTEVPAGIRTAYSVFLESSETQ